MKILGNITRLTNSSFHQNIFLVQVDYEDYGASYYGKSVKDTIYSFSGLTSAKNFKDFEKIVIHQMPFYSLDLTLYRLKKLWQWIRKKF